MACSVVAMTASPTVRMSPLDSTSRCISLRYSSSRGPWMKYWPPQWYGLSPITGASGRPGVFDSMVMTSMRKPSMPLSSHQRIIS